MSVRRFLVLAVLAFQAGECLAVDEIEWRHRAQGGDVTLTANPLGTAQRAAFYRARGFTATAIQPYAEACGFSFGMSNIGMGSVHTTLADWRAIGSDGRRVRLRPPAKWDADWEKENVPESARIAFRWAQFQAENSFEAGDWIMGMATLESPLPGNFRLIARYRDDKGSHEIVLDPLSCARD
ncbi:MAG: hypothetical protein K9K30_06230 [Burkholderiaceae bacterium]|nr:hypothetical protein [Burkholderiaceae bacterium]